MKKFVSIYYNTNFLIPNLRFAELAEEANTNRLSASLSHKTDKK